MARPIPRRTAEIELWDNVPVGNRTAWQREMLQFWALMLTQGRRLRTPRYLLTLNPETGRNRPRTVREIARLLSQRIAANAGHITPEITAALEEWLCDGLLVPGERVKGLSGFPLAGLAVPHYLGLALFAKGSTRERYWAATFYLWLASDREHTDLTGRPGVASKLDGFFSDGLRLSTATDPTFPAGYQWRIDREALAQKDPEVLLAARALTSDVDDGLPSFDRGLPREFFAGSQPVLGAERRFSVLCPGSVVLLRRSLDLLVGRSTSVGHGALGQFIETGLAHHAAQYYVRGMRVLNDLVRLRHLPDDCTSCWQGLADDVSPLPLSGNRHERWSSGDYQAAGTAADADFVERTCKSPYRLFINAGSREDQSAKDLGCLSLENLRQQLAEYTVNRVWLSLAWDVAARAAAQVPGALRPGSVAEVLAALDALYDNPMAVLLVASEWRTKLATLITDRDVPTPVVDEVLDALEGPAPSPRALEAMARRVISEAILSSRYFGRYVEVLNSILGGGALPTNQDPKGIVARGGRSKLPFHLSLNDAVLEFLVAVIFMEADAAGRTLSFTDLLDQLSNRYHLNIDRAPSHLIAGNGLVADATAQSKEGLRARLSAMGLLEEFSDSSSWNRIHWSR